LLFHNLRATRQTELEDQFPSHVVCAWLGNSRAVAREHYLRANDDHFSRALLPALLQVGKSVPDGASVCNNGRTAVNEETPESPGFCDSMPDDASECNSV